MTYSLRIIDLPSSERPRERLHAGGAKILSHAELLAILLGSGQGAGKLSAVGLGQYILNQLGANHSDALAALREVNAYELMQIHGVGHAKAASILAGVELGKRVFQVRPGDRTLVDDPAVAAAVLSHELMWQAQERFAVVLMDVKHHLLGTQVLTIGTATETLAHPREIFQAALRRGATRIIIAHNHPSGGLEPSTQDLELTHQLLKGAQLLGVPILDHLILGNGDFLSLRQHTSLWQEHPQGD